VICAVHKCALQNQTIQQHLKRVEAGLTHALDVLWSYGGQFVTRWFVPWKLLCRLIKVFSICYDGIVPLPRIFYCNIIVTKGHFVTG
jgi:hypothetical protein